MSLKDVKVCASFGSRKTSMASRRFVTTVIPVMEFGDRFRKTDVAHGVTERHFQGQLAQSSGLPYISCMTRMRYFSHFVASGSTTHLTCASTSFANVRFLAGCFLFLSIHTLRLKNSNEVSLPKFKTVVYSWCSCFRKYRSLCRFSLGFA